MHSSCLCCMQTRYEYSENFISISSNRQLSPVVSTSKATPIQLKRANDQVNVKQNKNQKPDQYHCINTREITAMGLRTPQISRNQQTGTSITIRQRGLCHEITIQSRAQRLEPSQWNQWHKEKWQRNPSYNIRRKKVWDFSNYCYTFARLVCSQMVPMVTDVSGLHR